MSKNLIQCHERHLSASGMTEARKIVHTFGARLIQIEELRFVIMNGKIIRFGPKGPAESSL